MRGKLATAGIAVLVVLAAAIALNERVPQEEGGEDRDSSLVSERVRIREFWQTYRGATAQRIAGRREEAAAEYRRALELNPRHEDALYYYANMQLELGAFEEAEGALRRLVEVNPVSARAHSRLGILYSCPETGDLFNVPAAEREFLRAHEINQEETGPVLHLGEVALMRGELAEADEWLDAVIGSNYSSVEAHFLRGYIAWKLGEREEATTLFARAIEFAQPAAPTEAVLEGETKGGSSPMLAKTSRCTGIGDVAEELRLVDEQEAQTEMLARYRALDEFLRQVRRPTGSESR